MRHRAAKMVRRATVDLFIVFDEIPALIAYWDRDQRCCYANRSYVDWFNYLPEDLLGRTMLQLLGPDLYASNTPYIEAALRGERQQFDRDLFHRPSGEMRHTQAHYIPDKVGDTVKGFTVLVFDVTDKVRAEKRALEAAEAKARFLATMSHEIRTPLNGITGMTSLLMDTSLDATQMQYVEAIQTSGSLLLSVLNDILDFSKIEAGKLDFETVPFSLQHLLSELHTALSFTARGKGLPLTFHNQVPGDAVFLGDPSRLKQVLNNLISNAIKFTSAGHVSLKVERLEVAQEICTLHFEVTDTGIGISSDTTPKLFQPFVQGDSSTSRRFGGSGLGLSISKYLVERMGGEIGVISEEGQGSRFWFRIKLQRASSLSKGPKSAHRFDPNLRFHGHALIVDDVALNQAVAVKMLEKIGMSAVAVNGGQEALDRLQRERFDIVFMDCNMPEMDGYEASRRIRSLKAPVVAMPIVAMTANAMKSDMDKCFSAGMNDYLPKPLTPQQLVEVVSRWLPLQNAGGGSTPMPSKPVLDAHILEQLQSLVPHANRQNLINELFEKFAAMIPEGLEKMRNAQRAGDRKALAFEAHRLKSVGAALGASRFAAVCQNLEDMPKSMTAADAAACIDQLALEFKTFAATLQLNLKQTSQRNIA
ncbi:MAG TPA: ATP-binding protein [Oligoflexus sp.]|uniref:PAS domain-containing sensor histidine kinase n=1 Tax=Oligoflexus sp. TaxID=1971216 RepID=UPI002D7ED298|nr:ATP-binding protein [Oligoflexus sp.]HET9237644.1 ATP-binding protein [Oligoflexus sp.]